MSEKLYYSMGEVAEMFDVNQSLLRHWESQFPILRPKRNKKGNRLFTPQDVEHLKQIYHLVKECGMTLEGAKRAMRGQRSGRGVSRDFRPGPACRPTGALPGLCCRPGPPPNRMLPPNPGLDPPPSRRLNLPPNRRLKRLPRRLPNPFPDRLRRLLPDRRL